MTTARDAVKAIDSNAFLTRIGVTDDLYTVNALVGILTGPAQPERGYRASHAAERFRNYLWFGPVRGGVTSAAVTRQVFAALGRADECDPNWI